MCKEGLSGAEELAADSAFESFLAQVGLLVDLENVVVAECLAADVAFVGFFSSVGPGVYLLNENFLFIEIPLKILGD